MTYLIEGLEPAQFAPLFALSDAALAERQIVAGTALDDDYPCRVSLRAAEKGDRLLLLNYVHLPAASPYRSAHAIFIAQGSTERGVYKNTIPPVMRSRILSVRAFDTANMMIDADIVEGAAAEPLIERLLALPNADYLHVHFAKRGCFAGIVKKG